MSQPASGDAPRRRGRPPNPPSDKPKRPRGRPPKPKPDPDEEGKDPDDTFLDDLKVVKRRRASLEFDQETLETIFHCARRACSQTECASILGVPVSALIHLFQTYPEAREVWDRGLDVSRVKLRSMQFKLAEKNQIMAIFLGKNMLGQRDAQQIDATISKPAGELDEAQLLAILAKNGVNLDNQAPKA